MNALMKSASDYCVCDNDIELLEAGNAREEIPICRIQPVPVGRSIANGDDDVPVWTNGRLGKQLFAHRVLVDTAGYHALSLELTERPGEEARLANQPLG